MSTTQEQVIKALETMLFMANEYPEPQSWRHPDLVAVMKWFGSRYPASEVSISNNAITEIMKHLDNLIQGEDTSPEVSEVLTQVAGMLEHIDPDSIYLQGAVHSPDGLGELDQTEIDVCYDHIDTALVDFQDLYSGSVGTEAHDYLKDDHLRACDALEDLKAIVQQERTRTASLEAVVRLMRPVAASLETTTFNPVLQPLAQKAMAKLGEINGDLPADTTRRPYTEGITRILIERERQVAEEHWTAEHDQEHTDHSLAWYAICLAAPDQIFRISPGLDSGYGYHFADPYPLSWDREHDKRPTGERDADNLPLRVRVGYLVQAGALIAAEIDRLLDLEDIYGKPIHGRIDHLAAKKW